jgi:hypothetical protein
MHVHLHHSQGRQSARLFLKSSELGPSPPPHPQASVSPTLVPGGTLSLAGEGVGEGSQFGRGDRHYGTLGINVLCVLHARALVI